MTRVAGYELRVAGFDYFNSIFIMLQIFKISIIVFLFTTILIACFGSSVEKDEIYIRIKNETGEEITKLWLGNLITKSNSLGGTSYQAIFENIAPNQMSEYQQNKGKAWGYHRGNFQLGNGKQGFLRPKEMADAVSKSGIKLVETTVKHPNSGELISKKTLPDGKYTFVIKPIRGNTNDFEVKIIQD